MRHWRTLLVLAAVTAVALTVVAVAYARSGSEAPGKTGRGAACAKLMGDPKTAEAMQQLRTEHRADLQAWSEKYGADPSSAAAQQALRELRQEHMREMRDLLEKAGIDVPEGFGTGRGCGAGGGGGGGCGGYGGGATGAGAGMMGGGMMGGGWSY